MIKNVAVKYQLATSLLMGLLGLIAMAQTKPNFTGAWKLNVQKSKFADNDPGDVSVTIEFNHKDNNLTEAFTVSGGGGGRTIEAKYSIDGKESEAPVDDGMIKATAKWEGDALVIEWRGPRAGRYFIRKLTLAADGKTMPINLKSSRPDGGTAEETWVFEKQ